MENLFFDKKDLKYCGNNVIIGKTVRIRKPEEVIIGDHVIIDDFTYIPCALEIGDYTHIGANCSMVGGSGKIKIGSFVNIAPSCQLVTGSNDYKGGGLVGPTIPEEYKGKAIIEPIEIGDFVLLACNTTILPGVKLPEGVATGAFTLLNKQQYNSWTLYIGIPGHYHSEREGNVMKKSALQLRKENK